MTVGVFVLITLPSDGEMSLMRERALGVKSVGVGSRELDCRSRMFFKREESNGGVGSWELKGTRGEKVRMRNKQSRWDFARMKELGLDSDLFCNVVPYDLLFLYTTVTNPIAISELFDKANEERSFSCGLYAPDLFIDVWVIILP